MADDLDALFDQVDAQMGKREATSAPMDLDALFDQVDQQMGVYGPETAKEYGLGLVSAPVRGLTFGFGDEAIAGTAAGLFGAPGYYLGLSEESPGQVYDRVLGQQRDTEKAFAARHPYQNFAAELTGALAVPVPAIRSAGLLKTAAKGAGVAGAMGAGYGFGTGEGGAIERVKNAASVAPLAAALGGTLPTVFKAAETLAPIFSQGARDKAVGRLLNSSAGDSQSAVLNQLEQFQPTGPFGRFQTTADVAQNPGLSSLEQAVMTQADGSPLPALLAERQAAQVAELTPLFSPSATRQSLNDALEGQVAQGRAVLKSKATDLWSQVPKETPVIVDHRLAEVDDILGGYFGTEPRSIPGAIKDVRDGIAKSAAANTELTLGDVQKWRSNLGKLSAKSTDGSERAAAGEIRSILDAALEENATIGITGADDVSALREAIAATRLERQTFNPETAKTIGRAAGISQTPLRNTQLIDEALRSNDAVSALINAQAQSGVPMTEVLSQGIVRDLATDAFGRPATPLSMTKRWGQLKEQFGPNLRTVMGDDAFNTVEAVVQDANTRAATEALGKVADLKNSQTSRLMSEKEKIAEAMGVLSPSNSSKLSVGGGSGAAVAAALNLMGVPGFISTPLAAATALGANKLIDPARRGFNEALNRSAIPGEAAKMMRSAGSPVISEAADKFGLNLFAKATAIEESNRKNTAPKVKVTQGKPETPKPKLVKAEKIEDVPLDSLLDAVAEQESGGIKEELRDTVVSPAGAIGRYQFMPATAKAYGIDPTNSVEARQGAGQMMTDLIKQFGDVELALAAYNYGSGNVTKLLKKYNAKSFAQIAKYLPKETRNYVPSVLKKVVKI